jgi:hypothetical protein
MGALARVQIFVIIIREGTYSDFGSGRHVDHPCFAGLEIRSSDLRSNQNNRTPVQTATQGTTQKADHHK